MVLVDRSKSRTMRSGLAPFGSTPCAPAFEAQSRRAWPPVAAFYFAGNIVGDCGAVQIASPF